MEGRKREGKQKEGGGEGGESAGGEEDKQKGRVKGKHKAQV